MGRAATAPALGAATDAAPTAGPDEPVVLDAAANAAAPGAADPELAPGDGEPAPLGVATVAIGRTVRFGGRSYGPGSSIELPATEVARLRAIGALVDPDKPPPPRASGAVYRKR